MLKNITEAPVAIKYGGREVVCLAGASIDVRDFGVEVKHVEQVEKHIILKNPNKFERIANPPINGNEKELVAKIEQLQKELQKALSERNDAVNISKENHDKLNDVLVEKDGVVKENKSLVKENKELKAKLKAVQ